MWFEIIPSFSIIVGALAMPGYALWWLHDLTLGNHYRRAMNSRFQRVLYQRDWRLTGDPYVVNGLDSLSDK